MPPPKRVLLMIYFPSRFIVKLNVNLSARVGELKKLMNLGSCQFVFKGQVLMEDMTFKFYRINERDTVVVVPAAPEPCEVAKWLDLTNDNDRFRDKMEFIMNEDTAREAARLRDVLLTKIERKPRSYRRFCEAVREHERRPFTSGTIALNLEYDKADRPSCEPLPVNWSSRDEVEEALSIAQDDLVADKPDQADAIRPVVKP